MYLDPKVLKEALEEIEFKNTFKRATGCDINFGYYDPTQPFLGNIDNLILYLSYNDKDFYIRLKEIIPPENMYTSSSVKFSRYRFQFTTKTRFGQVYTPPTDEFVDVCISDLIPIDIDIYKSILCQSVQLYINKNYGDHYIE